MHRTETDTGARRYRCGVPTGRGGFTLIELLVVIAIIALLVSILLPSLQKAKDLAKAAMCGSQTRNMALSYLLYREEWEFLPWGCQGTGMGSYSNSVGVGGCFLALRATVVEEMEDDGLDPIVAYRCPADPGDPRRWWYPPGSAYPGPRDSGMAGMEIFYTDDYGTYTYLDGRDAGILAAAEVAQVLANNLKVASHNNLTSDHAMVGCLTAILDDIDFHVLNFHYTETTYAGFQTAYGDAHVEWTNMPDEFGELVPGDNPITNTYTTWGSWYYWWE